MLISSLELYANKVLTDMKAVFSQQRGNIQDSTASWLASPENKVHVVLCILKY